MHKFILHPAMHSLAALLILFFAEFSHCLSDRIIADKCLSRHVLVEVVHKCCYKKASNFTFGGSCSSGFHSEIIYSCEETLSPKSHFEFLLPVFDEYRHDLRVSVLKNMALDLWSLNTIENKTMFNLVASAKNRYSFRTFDEVEKRLSMIESTMKTRNVEWSPSQQPEHANATLVSRQLVLSQLKDGALNAYGDFGFMTNRTRLLVDVMGRLLRGAIVNDSELDEYSLQEFLRRNLPFQFPELRKDLEEFYVSCARITTPGILSRYLDYLEEADAGKKLLLQYKQIFKSALVQFKYMDSNEKDFLVSKHQEPTWFWTDRFVVHDSRWTSLYSRNGCLPAELISSFLNKKCQKFPDIFYSGLQNTSNLYPKMIKLAFGKPCDTTNATFKEVLFECRFPQQPIRFPDSAIQKRFFQRYYIALMERYAGIVREYPVAKKEELAKDTRILAIEERLKLTHFEFHSNDRVESFDPVNYLYPFGFRPEDMFDNDDALFGSREYALTYPKAGIRFMLMPNRAKALLKCAMKLLKGESVSADELKYYDVESIRLVLSKEERPETVPYDNKRELLELLGDFYVEYAQDHTIAIGRKHLDFLSEPRSHLKLLEMYRKIFTFGHVDTSYLSDHYDD